MATTGRRLRRTGRRVAGRASDARAWHRRILLLESHHDTRELYVEYLRHVGFDVDAVATTDDAAQRVDEADVVITGIAVDGSVDGFGFVSRVRQEKPRTPIIVLTAHALDTYRQRALSAGANLFLTKPCLPEDLVQQVGRLLA